MVTELDNEFSRHGHVPGTSITRVLITPMYAQAYGLEIPKSKLNKNTLLVWNVGIGHMMEPKKEFLGFTMQEALEKAVNHVKKSHRKGKKS